MHKERYEIEYYLVGNPRTDGSSLSGLYPSTKSSGWRHVGDPQASILWVQNAEEGVKLVLVSQCSLTENQLPPHILLNELRSIWGRKELPVTEQFVSGHFLSVF